MEEVYIVKLKGLPPPSASSQESLSKDKKTSFYFHTDLTAEAIRGFAYLHIFFGLTVLCLSVTNLCFHENPFMLEPPLGITVWCSVAFIMLGFFGILTAYKRKCDLSRSIFYVKILFTIIVVVLSMTLTFIILFALDLHGPVANQFIGLNIIFSIVVESVILLLTLFTTARVLWPGCMNFCAKDWPMQPKFKRKVIVKTNVYAGGIQQDDPSTIQSVGPNCVISLNMPPLNPDSHLDKQSSASSGVSSTANSASSSPSSKTKSLTKACMSLSGLLSATSDLTNSSSTLYTVNSDQNNMPHHSLRHHHLHHLHHSNYESPKQLAISTHSIYHQKVAVQSSSVSTSSIASGSTGNLLQTFPTGTQNRKCNSTTGLYGNFNRLLYRYSHANPQQQKNGDLYSNDSVYSKYQSQTERTAATDRTANVSDDIDPYDTDEFDYCSTEDDDDHFNNPGDHNYEVPQLQPIGQKCPEENNRTNFNDPTVENLNTSKLEIGTYKRLAPVQDATNAEIVANDPNVSIVTNDHNNQRNANFDLQSHWSESSDALSEVPSSPSTSSTSLTSSLTVNGDGGSSMVNIVVNNTGTCNVAKDRDGASGAAPNHNSNHQIPMVSKSLSNEKHHHHHNLHHHLNLSDEDDKDEGIESSGSSTCSGEETIHQRNHHRLHSFIQQSYKSSIKIESGNDTSSETSSVGSPKPAFESKLSLPVTPPSTPSTPSLLSPASSTLSLASSTKPSIASKTNLIYSNNSSTPNSSCNNSSGPTIRFLNTTKSSKIVKINSTNTGDQSQQQSTTTPTESVPIAGNNSDKMGSSVSIKSLTSTSSSASSANQQQQQQSTIKSKSTSNGIVGGVISSKLASHPYLCRLRANNGNSDIYQPVGLERRLNKFVAKSPSLSSTEQETLKNDSCKREEIGQEDDDTPPDSPPDSPPASPLEPPPNDSSNPNQTNFSNTYRVPDIQRV